MFKSFQLLLPTCCLVSPLICSGAPALEAPASVGRFEVAEFVVRLTEPPSGNPFTDLKFTGELKVASGEGSVIRVSGFCDAQDGTVFRLRFTPKRAGGMYRYRLALKGGAMDDVFEGELRSLPSDRPGPVVADPKHPRHLIRAGSGASFYHLGFTAYHLLDPSNDDAQVEKTIRYAHRLGFNKIRFLLTGYPRDFDRRTSRDNEHGVPDPWKAPNYGSLPGQVNPLPAWVGQPHRYDFERFHVAYWQRVDRAVRLMRDLGMVATCIITIEKQDLPREYGTLTENEYRLYDYAIARLAAFDNVWWDLGNEHNEYRNAAWGNTMGAHVREEDSYGRLRSAHGYASFVYPEADWPGYIITQQYGDEKAVHDWVLKYAVVPKPYVNEEYGYEGDADKPGHAQNSDWVRRTHWSIAMAGGYATYGDWSGGVSYFYMGEPGPGKAATQLGYLRTFFEALPFAELEGHDEWVSQGFCLAQPAKCYVVYLPRGGGVTIDLSGAGEVVRSLTARWYDPRLGQWRGGPALRSDKLEISAPDAADWVLLIR